MSGHAIKTCNGVLRGVTVSEAIDIAGFPRVGTTGRLPLGLSRKKTIRVEYYVGRMVFGRPISPGCLEPELVLSPKPIFRYTPSPKRAARKTLMPSQLEISVILTTYQRPVHLERSLISLAHQRGMDGKFEVIVSDDGSTDHTKSLVTKFALLAPFPLHWVSHRHNGFRVSLCRNDGVRASSSPYFLFTDSDCIFPANHLKKHLAARRSGIIRAGDCIRLDKETTARVDEA